MILGEYEHISEGDTVKCTLHSAPVGPELIGRVVNALGQPSTARSHQRQDDRRDRKVHLV